MMSALTSISYGCDIARDPAQNRINHQAMVDELNRLSIDDGWEGVKVTRFETVGSSDYVTIEPGISPLTLDYLRRMKEAGNSNKPVSTPGKSGQQGSLI
ncbi:hypothetical protein ACRQ1B_06170 [Rhizobium panacihumi]|uniref:hypothetical protein n=1 Tax=Rhizobium panacihumi TaxID=2008450 RepID=UPI003D7B4D36